jgi:predicted DNA binding protein
MRRLIVECPTGELSRVIGTPTIQKIELLEVISFLRFTQDEVALICRIKFNDQAANVKEIFNGERFESQLLEEEENGACTFFIKKKQHSVLSAVPIAASGYVSIPYEIRDGKVKATFVGNAEQIRRIREAIEEKGIRHKVLSLTDARFPPSSPLSRLTEKQQEVLIAAYRLGYYDLPKRVSSEELARRFKIRSPTLVVHRRRAERRLLAEVIGP